MLVIDKARFSRFFKVQCGNSLFSSIRSNVGMAKQNPNQYQSGSRDNAMSGGTTTTGSTTSNSNQPASDERITLIVDNTR